MADDLPTSSTLLDRARASDADAWSRLVYLYEPLVRHWSIRWGCLGADADDLVQETFLALAAHLDPGETINKPMRGFSLDPADQTEWTPPALNDNRRLKAQIMDAIQGKQAPAAPTAFDDFKAQAASIQAEINRLNEQTEGK